MRFLGALYETGLSPARMVESADVRAFSPWKNPGAIEEGSAKLLLLFPPSFTDDHGAELRIEIDADDARLYVKDKDPRFRRGVVDALCAPAER